MGGRGIDAVRWVQKNIPTFFFGGSPGAEKAGKTSQIVLTSLVLAG